MRSLILNAGVAGYGALWVGVSDAGREGVWRFLNGKKYDPGEEQQPAWDWYNMYADDMYNCAYVYVLSSVYMSDYKCDYDYYGLCEIVTQTC